jgi:subfamily B ATP-binding cassette protein MsbA
MNKFKPLVALISPYKRQVFFTAFFTFFSVIFSLFSFVSIMPLLEVLFEQDAPVIAKPELGLSFKSLSGFMNYYLSQLMVDHDKKFILVLIIIFVIVAVFLKTLFLYLSNVYMVHIRNNVVKDLRNKVFTKILSLPLSYFSNERKGDLMSRMSGDIIEIEVSVVRSVEIAFKEPLTILVTLGWLIFISPQLTLFVLIMLPVISIIIGRIGKTLRKKSMVAQQKLGMLTTILEETLGGLRVIKAFNSEHKVSKKYKTENKEFTWHQIKVARRNFLATPLSEFLGTVVIAIILWYGGTLVLNNMAKIKLGYEASGLTGPAFIMYLVSFYGIINPAKAFSGAFYNIQKGLASVDRIEQVLKADNPIKEKDDAISITEFKDSIEFKNVSFGYRDVDVLKNIELRIEKGKTVALVGQSGSGKSTLVDLLPRFYDVDSGDILIDGISIKDYKLKDLRHLMGNVNQESILFNDTIFNNIAFGVENATEEEVIAAAKVANAHDFITTTSEGYHTNIGDRGTKLSGGQRQRIAIARAVLKNPPIMILDEATSALDTESERLVQDALIKLMENRTSIVVAHRLSTVIHADEICVLHEGEIVERGKHSELLKLNGVYKRLHDLQMFS